jgi:micrococcal nuclease
MRRWVILLIVLLLLLAACEPAEPGSLSPVSPSAPSQSAEASEETTAIPSPEPTSEAPAIATRKGIVTRVVDGDTAVVSLNGVSEKVRFIGINTPESTTRHEPYGAEASAYTKRALTGVTVYLETDADLRDQYQRLLAYVWLVQPRAGDAAEVRRSMFNARLLIDGYAQVATYPPNVKYVDVFLPLQREARDAHKGLWAAPASQPKAAPKPATKGKCDPSYPDVCIAPPPPDLNCSDVPYKRFRVVGDDPHGFDRDHDGVGCES